MAYTNTLRTQGDAVPVIGGKKKDASIDDLLLLDSGRWPAKQWPRSNDFRGEVYVLMNNGVQSFQLVEEGQHLWVVLGLVVAYLDNFLIDEAA